MSRIGYAPITLPAGVTITIEGLKVSVVGPKGQLEQVIRPEVSVEVEADKILVKRKNEEKFSKSLHGLTRALIQNMVIGVTNGWTRDLEMVGVGYRAQGTDKTLNLSVGFSHPVSVQAPEGVAFSVLENTKIKVSGIDKALVGQVAANIRAIKPPEPYKGKGVRFAGEYVRRKAGKAGKAAGAK